MMDGRSTRLLPLVVSGLLLTAAGSIVLAVGFDLSAIASIGSAIALVVFSLVTAGHLRVRAETGALAWVLVIGLVSTVAVLVSFIFTSLVHEPASVVTIGVILLVSVGLDLVWKHSRGPISAPTTPLTERND